MIVPKIVRSALFTTLIFVSAALAGCVGEEGTESPEDRISEMNLEGHDRVETEDADEITQEDCEERGGIWEETNDR